MECWARIAHVLLADHYVPVENIMMASVPAEIQYLNKQAGESIWSRVRIVAVLVFCSS